MKNKLKKIAKITAGIALIILAIPTAIVGATAYILVGGLRLGWELVSEAVDTLAN